MDLKKTRDGLRKLFKSEIKTHVIRMKIAHFFKHSFLPTFKKSQLKNPVRVTSCICGIQIATPKCISKFFKKNNTTPIRNNANGFKKVKNWTIFNEDITTKQI